MLATLCAPPKKFFDAAPVEAEGEDDEGGGGGEQRLTLTEAGAKHVREFYASRYMLKWEARGPAGPIAAILKAMAKEAPVSCCNLMHELRLTSERNGKVGCLERVPLAHPAPGLVRNFVFLYASARLSGLDARATARRSHWPRSWTASGSASWRKPSKSAARCAARPRRTSGGRSFSYARAS